MPKYIPILFTLLASWLCASAQSPLYGISTEEDDSFKEWIIYTEVEGEEGELERTWQIGENWTDWEYRLGEESGDVRMKWKNDPNSPWQLRGGGELITMRTKWRGDFTEWRVTDGSVTLELESLYKNNLEEWVAESKEHGRFTMYTTHEGDLRDWDIVDEMGEEVSFHMKMAMVFIVMYYSTPKI